MRPRMWVYASWVSAREERGTLEEPVVRGTLLRWESDQRREGVRVPSMWRWSSSLGRARRKGSGGWWALYWARREGVERDMLVGVMGWRGKGRRE